MSETVLGTYRCNLCNRDFQKYKEREKNQVKGISEGRSKTYSFILKFVAPDKTELNKHICTYCISDILNNFQD